MGSRSKHLPCIISKFIDHNCQRYDTSGDYQKIGTNHWYVTISKMSDWRYEALILIHELTEIFLVKHHKILWSTIDKWDMDHPELEEPGDHPDCPYHKEHMAATKVERLVAILLGVEWKEYQRAFSKLKWTS